MNVPRRFLLTPAEVAGEVVDLAGEELRHASVLRLREGEEVEVCDGSGRSRRAIAIVSRRGAARLRLGEDVPSREPRLRVTLAAALLDSDAFDQIVRDATQLGAERIAPLVTEHTRPALADGARKRIERWNRIAREAVKQCGRSVVPELAAPSTLAELLASLPAPRLALDFDGEPEPTAAGSAATLFVGPEGGWSERERNDFRNAGATFWSLGARTLRAETAALVALSRLLR